MFRPQIQKTRVLFVLAIINLTMVYIAVQNTIAVKSPLYDVKNEAKSEYANALTLLKSKNKDNIYSDKYLEEVKDTSGVVIRVDTLKFDPGLTGLITPILPFRYALKAKEEMDDIIRVINEYENDYEEYCEDSECPVRFKEEVEQYVENNIFIKESVKKEWIIDFEIDECDCRKQKKEEVNFGGTITATSTDRMGGGADNTITLKFSKGKEEYSGYGQDGDIRNGSITTSKGRLKAKQTVLKSDFAALIVEYFRLAKISKGDTIAVGMTGSMPGANIALLSACKAMGVYPVIISSLGSSEHGATNIDFTWIHMEEVLRDTIFNNLSVAYSYGGRGDRLKSTEYLSRKQGGRGRAIIDSLVHEYDGILIEHGRILANSLSTSVEERMEKYESHIDTISNYKAYVNIGGGASSIGVDGDHVFNKHGKLSPAEIQRRVRNLPDDAPDYSVVKSFADNDIPTINITRIKRFVKGHLIYGEIDDQKEDPLVEGSDLFYLQEYKLGFNIMALIVSFGSVLVLGIISHNQIKRRMQSYEPESIL